MPHHLSLSLKILDNSAEYLCLQLELWNQSDDKLLLPCPEITGLCFVNKKSLEKSQWWTSIFLTSTWGGVVLLPGDIKQIDYCVRPKHVEQPAERDDIFFDCYRWCVDLPPGDYLVWYQLEVGQDYFDGDSHYQLKDIQREAEARWAIAWTGELKSNRVHLVQV